MTYAQLLATLISGASSVVNINTEVQVTVNAGEAGMLAGTLVGVEIDSEYRLVTLEVEA